VAFIAVLVLLLGVAVAQYNKAFATVAHVTLKTDTAGNQLQNDSDVKVRGVIVGSVRDIKASVHGATIDLAIDPQYLAQIPADVSARLLPKTLFGEKYVSLVIPQHPAAKRLADGDVIGQDRTKDAIELQKVIDDTLPLLQAVRPQDLAYTLSAMATALRGKGNALGENLVNTGQYIGQINTVLPQFEHDISALADFSDTYNSAADDLLAVLNNLSITNSTIVDQKEQLRRTFTVTASSSDTLASFLTTNENSLISLAQSSKPVLGVFARYSPEYPCLLNGLTRSAGWEDKVWGTSAHPGLQLNITVIFPPRNGYSPGDQPQYADNEGPNCAGLNDIDGIIAAAQHGKYFCPATAPNDGVKSKDDPVYGNPHCVGGTGPNNPPPQSAGQSGGGQSLPLDLAGSGAELDFVRSILGYQAGVDPSKISDLSASTLAPLLRGTQVMLQ
jgi:virulence factor Mce-like protein